MRNLMYFLVILSGGLAMSCEEERQVRQNPSAATDTLEVKFQPFYKKEVKLSEDTRKFLADYEEFVILGEAVKNIEGSTIAEVKAEIEGWSETALQFYTKTEDSIPYQPVQSRILLLYTKSRILHQELAKTRIDTAVINKEATEYYNTFQDLKDQFNVMFLQSIDDFLKEFRADDSGLRSDRDDNNPIFSPNLPPARGNLQLEQLPDSLTSEL